MAGRPAPRLPDWLTLTPATVKPNVDQVQNKQTGINNIAKQTDENAVRLLTFEGALKVRTKVPEDSDKVDELISATPAKESAKETTLEQRVALARAELQKHLPLPLDKLLNHYNNNATISEVGEEEQDAAESLVLNAVSELTATTAADDDFSTAAAVDNNQTQPTTTIKVASDATAINSATLESLLVSLRSQVKHTIRQHCDDLCEAVDTIFNDFSVTMNTTASPSGTAVERKEACVQTESPSSLGRATITNNNGAQPADEQKQRQQDNVVSTGISCMYESRTTTHMKDIEPASSASGASQTHTKSDDASHDGFQFLQPNQIHQPMTTSFSSDSRGGSTEYYDTTVEHSSISSVNMKKRATSASTPTVGFGSPIKISPPPASGSGSGRNNSNSGSVRRQIHNTGGPSLSNNTQQQRQPVSVVRGLPVVVQGTPISTTPITHQRDPNNHSNTPHSSYMTAHDQPYSPSVSQYHTPSSHIAATPQQQQQQKPTMMAGIRRQFDMEAVLASINSLADQIRYNRGGVGHADSNSPRASPSNGSVQNDTVLVTPTTRYASFITAAAVGSTPGTAVSVRPSSSVRR